MARLSSVLSITARNVDRPVRHPHSQQSMADLYRITKQREEYLKAKGYNLVTIWECEFDQFKKSDLDMIEFSRNFKMTDRLCPRDAFFGGRTEAVSTYFRARESEEGHYMDFTSLYSWVNKYGTYPIGHPYIITDNFSSNINDYYGFIKCKILPPRGLFHPVLPYRHEKKLLFPLCRFCVENDCLNCKCPDEQRSLNGTWTTIEVAKAVDMGYIIEEIYEVYHFKESKTGLFASYASDQL